MTAYDELGVQRDWQAHEIARLSRKVAELEAVIVQLKRERQALQDAPREDRPMTRVLLAVLLLLIVGLLWIGAQQAPGA